MKKIIALGIILFICVLVLGGNTSSAQPVKKNVPNTPSKQKGITPLPAPAPIGTTPSSPSSVTPPTTTVTPKGSRALLTVPMEGSVGFDKTFAHMQTLGAQGIPFGLSWDEVEKGTGALDPSWYPSVNTFYSANKYSITSGLMPIDTNNSRLPASLKGKKWNDPDVISHYVTAADFVINQTPNVTVRSFSVGNEVDVYLRLHPDEWDAYIQFFQEVKKQLQAKHPGLPIGIKMTFDGITQSSVAEIKRVNAIADVVLVTYYPIDGGMQVRDPKAPLTDLATLVALYPNKDIQILEAGYPSSSANGGTEAKQAEFFTNLFAAWDSESTHIPIIAMFSMHDFSDAQLKTIVQYYGVNAPQFAGFLGSLGFFTADDKEKAAWGVVTSEAKKRGW